MAFFLTTLSLLVILTLAYQRVSQSTLFFALSALLAAYASYAVSANPWLLIPWTIISAFFAIIAVPKLRKLLISGPLLKQFKRVIPAMSDTEKEALNAGSVWWDAELFRGKPDWHQLHRVPEPVLTHSEEAFINGPVEELCKMIDDWDITHNKKDLPEPVWSFIKNNGFFSLIIPEQYGGLGFSALAHSAIVMKIASRSIAAAVTVMVPNSLGPGKLLLHYGTEQQKSWYLPRLADGREIPCFALTGPNAGSDAGAIPDNGIICYGQFEGRKILGINLNWDKRYITLGPVATVIGLAFKLYDPDHLIGNTEALGITVALIPRDTEGVVIGDRHYPLNIPFQNGPNQGHDVFIPMDWIVGGRKQIGQGWRMLVECLSEGRGISLPALATGGGKAASRYTGAYAAIRQQFGISIGQFEGIEEALARIAGKTYQMEAARLLTLSALDIGEKPSVVTAIVKYHLTERFRESVNDAMDIQGGSGICLGPSNLIGRVYQSIPIAITVEGANILTRSMIIFGQGAMRCHPWVLKEFNAAQNNNKQQAIQQFDHALLGHMGFLISNLVRSVTLGMFRGHFSHAPGAGEIKRYYQRLNWMSASFALIADVSMMTLGGALKRKERLSARLGDILSELYIASAVLKHYHNQGCPEEDLALLHWSMHDSLYRMQESFRQLFTNLPWKSLSVLMRLLIYPTGMPYSEPDDRAGKKAAQVLLTPSACRDRLTKGIYLSQDESETVGQLELAFTLNPIAKPLEKTLRDAKRSGLINGDNLDDLIQQALATGIITNAEKSILIRMHQLRQKVIAVDAFDSLFGNKQADKDEEAA